MAPDVEMTMSTYEFILAIPHLQWTRALRVSAINPIQEI